MAREGLESCQLLSEPVFGQCNGVALGVRFFAGDVGPTSTALV